MSQPLLENLRAVHQEIAGAKRILLFSDYDGTLTPIVNDPGAASLDPRTRETLARLSETKRISVIIISGRSLADVQHRVGVPGLIYAGSHGLEIRGPDFGFLEPTAERSRERLLRLSAALSHALGHIEGVVVEHKGLTSSVHYRMVIDRDVPIVIDCVKTAVAREGDIFRLTAGKKVCEIRPRADWDKGRATRWIIDRLGGSEAIPIYLGDDTTDEDAFASIPEGLTIRVGAFESTRARFVVDSPTDVNKFLLWLADTVQ